MWSVYSAQFVCFLLRPREDPQAGLGVKKKAAIERAVPVD